MTVSRKLAIMIFMTMVLALSVIISSFLTIRGLGQIEKQLLTYSASQDSLRLSQDLQLQVANVWQFITDASLTKDADVIQSEAKPAYESAHSLVKELLKLHANDAAQYKILSSMSNDLSAMWDTGIRMFDAYGRSQEEGDIAMDEYDKASESIIEFAAELNRINSELGATMLDVLTANTASEKRSKVISMFFIVLIGFIVTITMYLLRRSISKSFKYLIEISKTLTKGDLSITVEKNENEDEIAQLQNGFATLITAFNDIIKSMNSSIDTLANSSKAIANTSEYTTTDAHAQLTQSERMTLSVQKMENNIIEAIKSVDSTTDMTNNASSVAKSAKSTAEQGTAAVSNALTSTETLKTLMEKLSKSVLEIGEVVDVISGIADQTNLLALNAAIEAARAGDQGKGFAVVADEVRALAGRTIEATSKISSSIGALQTETKKADRFMGQTYGEISLVSDNIKNMSDALDNVLSIVQSVNSQMGNITKSMDEQSSSSADIAHEVLKAVEIAQGVEVRASDMRNSADELIVISETLKQNASKFKIK